MKDYETKTPRATFAVAAAALTALTIGGTVLWPAQVDANRANAAMLAVADRDAPAATAMAADMPHVDRIDVIAVREPRMSVRALHLIFQKHG
jgi:hypothetical protein